MRHIDIRNTTITAENGGQIAIGGSIDSANKGDGGKWLELIKLLWHWITA